MKIIENTETGLAAILAKREAYASEYEDDGFDSVEDFYDAFDALYSKFAAFPDPMPVYRGMAVSEEWIDSVSSGDDLPLGVHWTYDVDAARSDLSGHSHGAYVDPKDREAMHQIVVSATVPKSSVDWDDTFSKNLTYDYEAEIHILNAHVHVGTITTENDEIYVGRDMPTGDISYGR